MQILEDLCYELEDMLEPIVKKGDISPTELDNVKDAVKSIYYIETIKAMKEYGNSNDYSYGSSYRGSYRYDNSLVLQEMGLEPTHCCQRQILSLMRLPVPPQAHINCLNILSY